MKKFNLLILLGVFIFIGCSDSNTFIIDEPENYILSESSFLRLNFEDERSLENAIMSGKIPEELMLKSSKGRPFVNILSIMPNLKGSSEDAITYYEGLGFDTLVPNLNFAVLLNPDGELEVGREVIRITPVGTYRFMKEHEEEFHNFLVSNPDFSLADFEDEVYIISENIVLYNTFRDNSDEYELIFEDDLEPLVGYEDDDDDDSYFAQLKSSSEPDFDSFRTFKADRKTWAGGLMQNLIGSKLNHTLEFNSKRRLRGSFYFYNYGVYAEIGVTGETQKKNWIGWSGTKCDELRVGWRMVEIKKTIPDFYKSTMNDLQDMIYYRPQYIFIDGRYTKVGTLLLPDFKPTMKDKIKGEGIQAFLKWARKENRGELERAMEEAEALIVASRTEMYFYSSRDVVKFNEKKYTHVFGKSWMDFEIGWSNQRGFFVNNINSGNSQKATTYLRTIYSAFNSHRGTLMSGDVYVCGRFGSTWRGMKIEKKDEN